MELELTVRIVGLANTEMQIPMGRAKHAALGQSEWQTVMKAVQCALDPQEQILTTVLVNSVHCGSTKRTECVLNALQDK